MTTAGFRSCVYLLCAMGVVAIVGADPPANPEPPNDTIRAAIAAACSGDHQTLRGTGRRRRTLLAETTGPGPRLRRPGRLPHRPRSRWTECRGTRPGSAREIETRPSASLLGLAAVRREAPPRGLGGPGTGQYRRPHPDAAHPPDTTRDHVHRRGLRRRLEDHQRRPVVGTRWPTRSPTSPSTPWPCGPTTPRPSTSAPARATSARRSGEPGSRSAARGSSSLERRRRLVGATREHRQRGLLLGQRSHHQHQGPRSDLRRDPDRRPHLLRWRRHLGALPGGDARRAAASISRSATDLADDWLFASCGTLDQATVYRRKIANGTNWEPVLSQPGMGRTTLAIAPSRQNIIYALSASNVPGPNGRFRAGACTRSFVRRAAAPPGSWDRPGRQHRPEQAQHPAADQPRQLVLHRLRVGAVRLLDPHGLVLQRHRRRSGRTPNVVWAAGVDLFRSDNGGRDWGIASYWWASGSGSELRPRRSARHRLPPRLRRGRQHQDVHRRRRRDLLDRQPLRLRSPPRIDGICDPDHLAGLLRELQQQHGDHPVLPRDSLPGWGALHRRHPGQRHRHRRRRPRPRCAGDTSFGGDGGYTAVDPTSPNIVYAESQRLRLRQIHRRRSDLHAMRSTGSTRAVSSSSPPSPWISTNRSGCGPAATGCGGPTTPPAVWNPASRSPIGPGQISAIAVAPGNSQRVVGRHHRRRCLPIREPPCRTTGSSYWGSTRPRAGFVTSLAFEPGSQDVIYATYAGFGGRHVWRSEDYGETWEALDGTGSAVAARHPGPLGGGRSRQCRPHLSRHRSRGLHLGRPGPDLGGREHRFRQRRDRVARHR